MAAEQDTAKTLEYYTKNKFKMIGIIAGLFLIAFGVCCILMPEELVNDSSATRGKNAMIEKVAFGTIKSTQVTGYIVVPIGLFLGFAAIVTSSSKPLLSADENNLYIGQRKPTIIAWKDISELEIIKFMNIDFLSLSFHNPQQWIEENAKNKVEKLKMKNNLNKRGTPVMVPVNTFSKSPTEVCNELKSLNS